MEEIKDGILPVSMEDILHNSMIPYAEYVILDRALPRVEDGLKPVQRRILYTMYDLGILPDKGYKKSARVVGECLGKYHPHGDTSVYDAMVRLAQSFNMRMTLVDGHGNFGSVDGDGAAAMRYTEVKLQPLALEILEDLDKETVDWQLNFDDSLKEPVTLPGRFPNLLVNGASGIAVGLATNIPTHNLGEVIDGAVAYIDNPRITLKEMMKIIKGPDFSTGGILIAGDELEKAYETGKGKVLLRAKCNIEQDTNDKKNIVITELPYQVNKAKLLEKIASLKEEKKDDVLNGIYDIVDESDRNGMRAVIKIKKDYSAEAILDLLMRSTNLQVTFGINMVAIAEGKPMQLGLIQILKYYVEYQREVILRRTKFDLNKAKERAHLIEGLIIAVTNIDEVVRIIKNSPDTTTAKANLRKKFDLSEKQAQAILDLRLARLTKLEVNNLKEELKELKETIKKLQAIVDSKKLQMDVVKTEITALKKKYKDERRTKIVKASDDVKVARFDDVKPIVDYVVGITTEGKIRKIKESVYNRAVNQEEPDVKDMFVNCCKCNSEQQVIIFSQTGNCYKLPSEHIVEAKGSDSKGVILNRISDEIPKSEKPVGVLRYVEEEIKEQDVMFVTKQGMVKRTPFSEYNLSKLGYVAIKLKEKDEVISVIPYESDKDLFFVTEKGMCLKAENEIPTQGRVAGGVKGMDVADDDKLIFTEFTTESESNLIVIGTSFGTFKKVMLGTIAKISRARKGVKICDLGDEKYGECVICVEYLEEGKDKMMLVTDRLGTVTYVDTRDVMQDSRTSKGKPIKSIGKCQPQFAYCARRPR